MNSHESKIWHRIFSVAGVDESKIPDDGKFSASLLLELKDNLIKKWGGSRIIKLKRGQLTKEEQEAQDYYNAIKQTIHDQAPDVAKYDDKLDLFNKYDANNPMQLLFALVKEHYLIIVIIVIVIAFLKYIYS